MKIIVSGAMFLLLLTIECGQATLLWRINVEPPAYILGTIHIPYPMIWPSISGAAKAAFENSTHFFPEMDATDFFSVTRLRMCLQNVSPPPGSISPPFNAGQGSPAPFLDLYLMMEARRTKKSVIGLENLDIYCEFSKVQAESFHLPSMAQGAASGANPVEAIRHFYNCDMNEPGEFLPSSSLPPIDPSVVSYQQRLEEIVARRDTAMASKINQTLHQSSSKDRLFFAVGFLHLMNPNGIVGKLKRDYHYSISRLCSDPRQLRVAERCEVSSWCDFHAE